MKIEIWSDFTCPFCYIGKRKFELALEQFENKQYATIEFKSFQLNSSDPNDKSKTVKTMLMKKYGITMEKAKEMLNQICEEAEQVGLTLHIDNMEHTNTFNAHRLVKFAEKLGKEATTVNRLFEKYFIENENIGNKEVLLSIAQEMDFDQAEVEELLSLNSYSKAVQEDELLAEELGVDDVPYFVFNEKYALSGTQPTEVFLSALEQLWLEEKDIILTKSRTAPKCKTSYCVGDNCDSE